MPGMEWKRRGLRVRRLIRDIERVPLERVGRDMASGVAVFVAFTTSPGFERRDRTTMHRDGITRGSSKRGITGRRATAKISSGLGTHCVIIPAETDTVCRNK